MKPKRNTHLFVKGTVVFSGPPLGSIVVWQFLYETFSAALSQQARPRVSVGSFLHFCPKTRKEQLHKVSISCTTICAINTNMNSSSNNRNKDTDSNDRTI